jgi:hypothetical protein
MIARDLTGNIIRDRDDEPDKPATKHSLSKSAKARQAERIAALQRDGWSVVKGQAGLTVYRTVQFTER